MLLFKKILLYLSIMVCGGLITSGDILLASMGTIGFVVLTGIVMNLK